MKDLPGSKSLLEPYTEHHCSNLSSWGSKRPEIKPVALFQWRTGGSPGARSESKDLPGSKSLLERYTEHRSVQCVISTVVERSPSPLTFGNLIGTSFVKRSYQFCILNSEFCIWHRMRCHCLLSSKSLLERNTEHHSAENSVIPS